MGPIQERPSGLTVSTIRLLISLEKQRLLNNALCLDQIVMTGHDGYNPRPL